MSFDSIIQAFPADIAAFTETGELSDKLFEALYEYYLNSGDMPYGVAKARTGDPYTWIAERLESDL